MNIELPDGSRLNVDIVISIIKDIVSKEPHALLTYGSRVNGYSKEDSDYDIIAIINELPGKIRYVYKKDEERDKYISLLLVDKKWFEKDAYKAYLGEFVLGRLLSRYIPIINEDYLTDLEIAYKERVIKEELSYLINEYGELIYDLIIPVKYILFARLRKRMITYPHVRYSYIKTYYGPMGNENLKWAINRLIVAAKNIISEGIIDLEDDDIIIRDLSRLRAKKPIYSLIGRGIKSYIVHGLSAKVPIKVVGEELKSKVKRGIETLETPKELSNPKLILKTKGNIKIVTEKLDIERLLSKIYQSRKLEILRSRREGVLSTVRVITIRIDGEEESIVVKKYSWLSLPKWILIQLWTIDTKRFHLTPKRRLLNEYNGLKYLMNSKLANPVNLMLIDWKGKRLITEYIHGTKLSEISNLNLETIKKAFNEYGKILGKIHSENYVVGDTKPQNIIVNNGLSIVDLEQWSKGKNKAWDISLFLFYTFKFKLRVRDLKNIITQFINGYLQEGGDIKDLLKAVSIRYMRIFIPLLNPIIMYDIRKTVRKYVKNISSQVIKKD